MTAVVPALASTAGRSNAKDGGSISSILRTGDIVTGVRGTTNGNVILTGSAATGNGSQTNPFLYRGRLTSAAAGAAVSELTPLFPGRDVSDLLVLTRTPSTRVPSRAARFAPSETTSRRWRPLA